MKRLLSLLLAAVLCAGLIILPGCELPWKKNKEPEKPRVATTYPYVFVHGLNGFGDDTDSPVSYWGSTAGSILTELQKKGYMCFAPSVNPVGSAWDRACELYAALAGTRVDYGAAHSAQYGHERFGKTYTAPLIPDWGKVDTNGNLRKVNLIAHSFGGATVRLMCALLQNGSPSETAAIQAGDEPCSALFKGGKGDWVFSLTCLAAPHNGVSLLTMLDVNPLIAKLATTFSSAKFDDMLSSLGFTMGNLSISEVIRAAKTQDTAYYDLSINGAKALNKLTVNLNPDIYLFSYPIDGTDHGKPIDAEMGGVYKILGNIIGNFTSPENGIDDKWRANDCLVNTISATAPFNEPSQTVTDPNALSPTILKPASWYIMPTIRGTHGSVVGLDKTMAEILPIYTAQIVRIDNLSKFVTGGVLPEETTAQ